MPHYKDSCEHVETGKGRYIGTYVYQEAPYDVYIYSDIEGDLNICVRFGPNASNFYGVGELEHFMTRGSTLPQYVYAKKVIEIFYDMHPYLVLGVKP